MKKIVKAALCFVMALCMVNIAPVVDASSPSSVIVAEAASKIKINKTKIYITKGTKYTLKVTGTKKKVKWTVGNKKTATVSTKGVVTAKNKGKTIVTAKVAGKKLKCTVYVETPSISAKTATITIHNRKTIKLNGTKRTPAWKSSNTKVATVSKGVISAKGVGTATITATLNKKNYTCNVTVKEPSPSKVGNSANDITDGIIKMFRGEITESEFRNKYEYPMDYIGLSKAYVANYGESKNVFARVLTNKINNVTLTERFYQINSELTPEVRSTLKKTYIYNEQGSIKKANSYFLGDKLSEREVEEGIQQLDAFNTAVLGVTDENLVIRNMLCKTLTPDVTGDRYSDFFPGLFSDIYILYAVTDSGVYFIGIG
ncbi:MAG: hypothetical protein E7571_09255 [Ruminococcaceae bacterium]|nr:hypothetical protein [Oscillospiraceae bacterium]